MSKCFTPLFMWWVSQYIHRKDVLKFKSSCLQLLFSRVADQSPVKLLILQSPSTTPHIPDFSSNSYFIWTTTFILYLELFLDKRVPDVALWDNRFSSPSTLHNLEGFMDFHHFVNRVIKKVNALPGLDAFTAHHKSTLYSHRRCPHL